MQQLDVLKDCVDDYEWIITTISLEELDNLKTSENLDKAFKARKALEWIDNNEDKIKFIINDNVTSDVFLDARFDLNKNDNKIINCCVSENAKLMSEDRALKIKAKAVGIDVLKLESIIGDNEFKGYKEVYFDDLDMAMWYEGEVRPNKWGLLNNEYLIIRDAKKKEVADILRWTNQGFKPLKYKTIKNKFIGNVIPRNTQQKILFDIMQDDNIKIKCAKGGYGVGKDFCMLSHAIDLIEKNKYENLIWIRNITNLRNVSDIGFLPGSADEKLLPWAMIMADHLGGEDGLKYFLSNGKIQLQHLGYIRGRSFRNSILYCSEAENLTKELMQLLISRVGDGSVLYINGDYKQVDHKVFEANSGLNAIVDKFKGYDEFGFVELEKIERSKVAQMAALLD
jgi:predicted ribonuclease YlaK